MAAASEEALVLQAFRDTDGNKDGRISRAELASVFREIDAWSNDDLEQMLDFFDQDGFGLIAYKDFIAWAMAEDGGAATLRQQQANMTGGMESDSEGDDNDVVTDRAVEMVSLDLKTPITAEEWQAIMMYLNQDVDDAKEMWDSVLEEFKQLKKPVGDTFPLLELLEELKVSLKDNEMLKQVSDALSAVKSGQRKAATTDSMKSLNSALMKILRAVAMKEKTTDSAWELINSKAVYFSKAEEACIAQFRGKEAELVSKVKHADINPPVISSSAGQNAGAQRCAAEVAAIIQRCKASGQKFSDPEWDVSKPQEMLYVDKAKPGWDCTVAKPAAFKRVSELIDNPVLFKDGIKAGDIVQGQIGTCFLLGGMGAIAAHDPGAIQKCFVTYDIELGVYGVRFNLDGDWESVIVDDYVPVDAHGRLLFSKSRDPQEVWCSILEKAYCKLHTCYEMCDGGMASEAIFAFFGGCSGKLLVQDKHRANPSSYFAVLKQSFDRGWLMTTTFKRQKNAAKSKSAGKCGEEVTDSGLVFGHVYSTLKVVEAHGNQLIQFRNPWGQGEWQGKWSDKNSQGEWTPEMKAATGYTGDPDGKFWMSVQDYVQNSAGADFARNFGPNWRKVTQYGTFQKGMPQATTMWAYAAAKGDELTFNRGDTVSVEQMNPGWWFGSVIGGDGSKGFFPGNYVKLKDRPVSRFDIQIVPEAGKHVGVVPILMQPNARMLRRFYKRKKDGMNYKDTRYGSVRMVVVGEDGKIVSNKQGKKRLLSAELSSSKATTYRLYVMSLDGMGTKYMLRLYCQNGTVTLKEAQGASIAEVTTAEAASQ